MPKILEENPLIDVIAEVRFSSQTPQDLIVGLVYNAVKDSFDAPQSLPVLQIPPQLRENDPNLRYAACYKFEGKGHYLLLSPRSVALGTPRPYKDWNSISPKLKDLFTKLGEVKLFDKVERTGLRYVNFFEGLNVLQHTTLSLELGGKSIADQNIIVRAENKEGRFITVFQLANTVTTADAKQGSILDIDVICEPLGNGAGSLTKHLYDALKESNAIADKTFFGMLKPDLINKLKPVY